MNRRDVLSALGLTAFEEPLAGEWEAAVDALPAGRIAFLTTEHVTATCETVGLSRDAVDAVADAAERIAAVDELRVLAWYFHFCLFRSDGFDLRAPPVRTSGMADWPRAAAFEQALGDARGSLYLLVVLSGLSHMAALHEDRSLPTGVRKRETAGVHRRIRRRVDAYRETHGVPGLDRKGCYWIAISLRGEIFRLGRLRFQFARFRPAQSLVRLRAFRHDRTGEVVALSADGVRYHADGQLAPDDGAGWTARLERMGGSVRGHPLDPTGTAVRETVRLPLEEWTEVFGPDVAHLRIHIPGDGPMTFGACGESFARALEFFPRYFSDRPFEAFLCTSWILDTQLQSLLPPTANMVRFQRELYLFPTYQYRPDDRRLPRRVLGELPSDPVPADGETSLETALLEGLAADEAFHSRGGGGFLLPEDLDWGSQGYRRQRRSWAPPNRS